MVESPFVGFNRGLANVAGAPVDVANWAMGKVGLPVSEAPFGGSESIKRGLGLIGANPDEHKPNNTTERILQAGGEGAAGMLVPAGAMTAAGSKFAAVAPKSAQVLESALGTTKTLPSALGTAGVGFAGGITGEAGRELTERYAPDSPWAQFGASLAGNLLGGAGAAGIGAGTSAALRAAKPGAARFADRFTQSGQERLAAEQLAAAAGPERAAIVDRLENEPQGLVPGSKPTLFQATGNMGIGQLERDMAKASPEGGNAFLERRAEQNAARVGALNELAPAARAEDVARFFRTRLQDVGDRTQALLDQGTAAAQGKAAAINPDRMVEDLGSALRGHLADALETTKQREHALWSAVDPTGKMVIPASPISDAARKIAGEVTESATPMSGEEARIFGVAARYGEQRPFNEVKDLRSSISTAMRAANKSGDTQSLRRLTILRGSVESAIEHAVENQAALDNIAVRRGIMAPDEMIQARLQQDTNVYSVDQNAIATSRGGDEFGNMGASSGASRLSGTTEPTERGFGSAKGAPGVSSEVFPTFDRAATDRLKEASGATKERAQTYGQGAVFKALKTQGDRGNYRMPDSAVPGTFFHQGPVGYDVAQAYHAAVRGDPPALATFHDAAAESLWRAAATKDGTIDPKKLAQWQARYQDAIRALPGDLKTKFSDAAVASQAVADAAALRKQALDTYQQGAIGKLLKVSEPEDVTRTIGSIFGQKNSVGEMKRLATEASRDPDAKAGLRKAVADYMIGRFISNTEAATSGANLVKADHFQTFVRQNMPALRQVFSPEEIVSMNAVAADLHRANRSIVSTKIPGGSNTPQDILPELKKMHAEPHESLLGKLWKAVAVGGEAGPAGAILGGAGAVAQHTISKMGAAGLTKVEELVREALLNPELAATLMRKAPVRAGAGPEISLGQQLKRLSMFGPIEAGGNSQHREEPPPLTVRRADGGRINPSLSSPASIDSAQRTDAYAGPTMQAYEPTWRDRIGQALMGGDRASPERRNFVHGLVGSTGLGSTGMSISDFVPGLGQGLGAQEAIQHGDYQGAALAAMPVGAALKGPGKATVLARHSLDLDEPTKLYGAHNDAAVLEAMHDRAMRSVWNEHDFFDMPYPGRAKAENLFRSETRNPEQYLPQRIPGVPVHGDVGDKAHALIGHNENGDLIIHGLYADRSAAAKKADDFVKGHWPEHGSGKGDVLDPKEWARAIQEWNKKYPEERVAEAELDKLHGDHPFFDFARAIYPEERRAPYPGAASARDDYMESGKPHLVQSILPVRTK